MIASDENFIVLNEAFPDLGRRIEFLWGDRSCRTFMYNLINDTRAGQRQGFSQPVSMAIIALSVKHDNDFPAFIPAENIWLDNTTRTPVKVETDWRLKRNKR